MNRAAELTAPTPVGSSDVLGHTSPLNLVVNTSLTDSINNIAVMVRRKNRVGVSVNASAIGVVCAKKRNARNWCALPHGLKKAAHTSLAKPE